MTVHVQHIWNFILINYLHKLILHWPLRYTSTLLNYLKCKPILLAETFYKNLVQ